MPEEDLNVDGDGQQPGDAGEGQDAPRTFTQAEVDGILQRRLDRQKDSLLKKYADYDELLADAKNWRKAEEEKKSDLEKLQTRLDKARNSEKSLQEQLKEERLRSAFIREAMKLDAKHPDDAYLLADHSNIVFKDDGTIEGVTEAVSALVEDGRLPKKTAARAPELDGGAGGKGRGQGGPAPPTALEIREMAAQMNVSPKHLASQYGVKLD